MIVFQNKNFVVGFKPSNWLSVPSRLGKEDSRKVFGLILQEELKSQIYPCHRLDYEVSGLMMFALNPDAHKVSQNWFETKSLLKNYLAFTEVSNEFQENTEYIWESKILRGKKRSYFSPHGKDSITHAFLLSKTQSYLKWKLSPITGRPHQLRVECYNHKIPILGDSLYSSQISFKNGIALQAYELIFPIDLQNKWDFPKKIMCPDNLLLSV